jgi:ribonucleoside-diphosphate reductase beta chain
MNSMLRELTSLGGLDRDSFPLRLYEKAKRLGTWNPSDVDLTCDKEEWARLADAERDLLLRVTALFQAGEESVVLDLLPLLLVAAREGRLEDELFLTAFLWEEGKHTDFFRRFLDEVCEVEDVSGFGTPSYHSLFYEELPNAMAAVLEDESEVAQARALVTYTMIIEGVLAETGYHGYFTALERQGLLTGLRDALANIKRDESRHIAYGVYALSRLVRDDPSLWETVEHRMNQLLPLALSVVQETFALYDPMPFELELGEFVEYATDQFGKRFARVEGARRGVIELDDDEAVRE